MDILFSSSVVQHDRIKRRDTTNKESGVGEKNILSFGKTEYSKALCVYVYVEVSLFLDHSIDDKEDH